MTKKITWNGRTFEIVGKDQVGITTAGKRLLNESTGQMSHRFGNLPNALNPLGPVERSFNPAASHVSQGTMRAHHVADSQIQKAVLDFMNNDISFFTMVDLIGALYQTGWTDMVLPTRFFTIWAQWSSALMKSSTLLAGHYRSLSKPAQASLANGLVSHLSSSLSNLRIGHGDTDSRIGNALAPRLMRGQFDLIYYLVGAISRSHRFGRPTLSAETSIVAHVWGEQYRVHKPDVGGGMVRVDDVYIGPTGTGEIYISEERPTLGAQYAAIARPQNYPLTAGKACYLIRYSRPTMQIFVIMMILLYLVRALGMVSDLIVGPSNPFRFEP